MVPGTFGFRWACYTELGWTPETVFNLPESEAQKIAIVLEETWAYEYRENRKHNTGSGTSTGLQQGFEEDFTFGDDDDNDYTDKMGLIEFWRKEEIRRGISSSVTSQ